MLALHRLPAARLIPAPAPREPFFTTRCGSMVSTGLPRLTTTASMTPKILGVGQTVSVSALAKSYASGVLVRKMRRRRVHVLSECACATISSRRNVRDTRKGAAVAPAAGGRRTCGLRVLSGTALARRFAAMPTLASPTKRASQTSAVKETHMNTC